MTDPIAARVRVEFDAIVAASTALATPFERWCELLRLSPEAPLAWESFEASRLVQPA